MSPTVRVEQIAPGDQTGRRQAAAVAFRAYAWCPQAAIGVLIGCGAGACAGGITAGPAFGFLEAAVMAPIVLVLWGLGPAWLVYRGPVRPGRRLFVSTTPRARAVVLLRPDSHHSAHAGDLYAYALAASPKGQRASDPLDEHLDTITRTAGARLTAVTTPWLAPAYRRRGFVDAGRTLLVLRRLVRPSRDIKPSPEEEPSRSGKTRPPLGRTDPARFAATVDDFERLPLNGEAQRR